MYQERCITSIIFADVPPGNIDERGPYVIDDMVIPREQLMESRAGILGGHYRWAKGRIPYVIDSKFSKFSTKMPISVSS